MQKERIVIVGGGAGGLELATRLGRKLGKKHKADIILIDANPTHLWKPLLHEVASGALDSGIDELDYLAHGKRSGYRFRIGRMCGLDRENREVVLEAMLDEDGETILPTRSVKYDTLVLALGSVTNDFGTKGAAQHCIFLDKKRQAEKFHQRLLNAFLRHSSDPDSGKLKVAIVGAGATGVELSAELFNTAEILAGYGVGNDSASLLEVTLIEAGDHILPALPQRISDAATKELRNLGVEVRTATRITEVTDQGFVTAEGELIEAELRVWAAGVKAADFVGRLGFMTNRSQQIIVDKHLRTEDERIFAIGDCCSFTQENGKPVPPRAQAAHQMASHVGDVLLQRGSAKPLAPFRYLDRGSLVSLSQYSTVGSLMGNLTGKSLMIEGRIARMVYISLYRMHQIALHGYFRTGLMFLTGRINRVIRPRLKLH